MLSTFFPMANLQSEIEMLSDIFADSRSGNYPPYSLYVEEGEEKEVVLELAVAGFSIDDLDIEFDKKYLTISGRRKEETTGPTDEVKRRFIHQGLARRSFFRRFETQSSLEVVSVVLDNGILTVRLRDTNRKVRIPILTSTQPVAFPAQA